jgi:hypothetical protein
MLKVVMVVKIMRVMFLIISLHNFVDSSKEHTAFIFRVPLHQVQMGLIQFLTR